MSSNEPDWKARALEAEAALGALGEPQIERSFNNPVPAPGNWGAVGCRAPGPDSQPTMRTVYRSPWIVDEEMARSLAALSGALGEHS